MAAKEVIHLPNDLTARVLLRNSRMRQGLALDAPLFFPGHNAIIFFRATNVSGNVISLDASTGIAQITFEHVDGTVEHPYEGAFSGEFDYRGLGRYAGVYEAN